MTPIHMHSKIILFMACLVSLIIYIIYLKNSNTIEINQYNNKIQNVKSQMEVVKENEDKLKVELDTSVNKEANSKKELTSLKELFTLQKERLETCEEEVEITKSQMNLKITAANTEHEECLDNLAKVQHTVEIDEEERIRLIANSKTLQEKVIDLEESVADKDSEIVELNTKVESLKDSLQESERKAKDIAEGDEGQTDDHPLKKIEKKSVISNKVEDDGKAEGEDKEADIEDKKTKLEVKKEELEDKKEDLDIKKRDLEGKNEDVEGKHLVESKNERADDKETGSEEEKEQAKKAVAAAAKKPSPVPTTSTTTARTTTSTVPADNGEKKPPAPANVGADDLDNLNPAGFVKQAPLPGQAIKNRRSADEGADEGGDGVDAAAVEQAPLPRQQDNADNHEEIQSNQDEDEDDAAYDVKDNQQ